MRCGARHSQAWAAAVWALAVLWQGTLQAQTYQATPYQTVPYPMAVFPTGDNVYTPYPADGAAVAAPYSPPNYAAVPAQTLVGPQALPTVGTYPVTQAPAWDTPVRLAQVPLDGTAPVGGDGEPESLIPPGSRNGVFQKVKFTAAYLPQLESDSLGVTDLRTSVVLGLPFFTRETPLVIEPEYRVRFLDRPAFPAPDLPPRLHDASIEFRHFRRLGGNWIFDGALQPGFYADDHSFDSSDAFRLTGRALFVYEQGEAWKWIMGIVYVNREGTQFLPAAGLAYHTDWVEYELVFPRPRAAWMLPGSVKDQNERWLYLMGEFGGGQWAIQRPTTGTPDNLTIDEISIIGGYEHKIIGGLTSRIELGYVFARKLKFTSNLPASYHLDDTVMVRAGFAY